MNETEIDRLALAGNALRPDWPTASLRTFLSKNFAARAYRDVALVLANVCTIEPRTDTPQLMLQPSVWGVTTVVGNRSEADRHPATVPFNELCHICSRERRHCEALDNGHDYKARSPYVRESVYAAGARKAREALVAQVAPLPPTTDNAKEATHGQLG